MFNEFQAFSILIILACTLAGGWLPLRYPERARNREGFPLGKPFSCGVFLALSLVMMLPSGFHLFGKAFPGALVPAPPVVAAVVFFVLLFLEHREADAGTEGESGPFIPIFMTIMIAIPSLLLGVALGVSDTLQAVVILLAIVAHKGSAGFALAMKMVRSSLTRSHTYILYGAFTCATPLGILIGNDVRDMLTGNEMTIVKGVVLSAASGVFLYMATLHDLKRSPLVVHCHSHKGFIAMVLGFVLTVGVRFLIGEAHAL